jgi:hypothetical protein
MKKLKSMRKLVSITARVVKRLDVIRQEKDYSYTQAIKFVLKESGRWDLKKSKEE